MFDLARLDIDLALATIDLGQNLSGVRDGTRGLHRVGVALEREIGQGLQVEDVGTGQHEEITEHPVAGPGLGQGGQAVEQEEGTATRLADLRPDLGNKPLKAQGDIQVADLARIALLEQGGWSAKRK